MKNKINQFLLGILWLLAVTLGASFWLNTVYGFNIFSASHWEYLAYMQASKLPINQTFYVSVIIIILLAFIGLYALIRPRLRKFNKNLFKHPVNTKVNVITDKTASALETLPAETQSSPITQNNITASLSRPPRLVLPTLKNDVSLQRRDSISKSNQSDTLTQNSSQEQNISEIKEIFSSAGYSVKSNTKINGIQTALIAIGANENLWIGATGIKTTDLRTMIEKLEQIFADTLEDIYINVNGFVINAIDASTSEFQDILMFNSISELEDYIKGVPNAPIPDDEKEDFEAYSQYIDTVINYIGKM